MAENLVFVRNASQPAVSPGNGSFANKYFQKEILQLPVNGLVGTKATISSDGSHPKANWHVGLLVNFASIFKPKHIWKICGSA